MENTTSKYTSDISDVDNMDGLEFEAFCCELLRCNSYTNVRKTQASGDYGLDVIATTKDGIILGIQCKNYQGTVGISAVQEAKSGSDYYNCDIAIVLTNSTFTKAAVELAKKINVKLWDRKKLKELIKVFPEKQLIKEKSIVEENVIERQKINVDYTSNQEFRNVCYDLLKLNGFTIIVGRYYDIDTFYVIANKNNASYEILLENRIVTVNSVEKLSKIHNENKCQNTVILTDKSFTGEAKIKATSKGIIMWDRDKFIKLSQTYHRKEKKPTTFKDNSLLQNHTVNTNNQNSKNDTRDMVIGCCICIPIIAIIGLFIWYVLIPIIGAIIGGIFKFLFWLL